MTGALARTPQEMENLINKWGGIVEEMIADGEFVIVEEKVNTDGTNTKT